MRVEDKPFVYHKSGSGVKISPRNASGWRAFAAWMIAFFGATGVFVWMTAVADAEGWSDGDILDVSRYLNESIYRFEQTADPVSSPSVAGHSPASRLALRAPHR